MPMTVRKQFILPALIAGAVVFGTPLFGQEPFSAEGIPPGSDFVYRKQYDQVQEIMKTPDLAQREQKLSAYYQKLQPEAKIQQYMEAYFGQILEEYQKKRFGFLNRATREFYCAQLAAHKLRIQMKGL